VLTDPDLRQHVREIFQKLSLCSPAGVNGYLPLFRAGQGESGDEELLLHYHLILV